MKEGRRAATQAILIPALIALAIYLAHAAALGSWIIDDAGISFAYARNLAMGHGLVSQPGAAPVEGFTNLLWTLILAATIKLGVFDPVVTPKLLAAVAVALAFALTARLMTAPGTRPVWLTAGALSITAATTGFVVWCASGLENALYVLLASVLALVSSTGLGSERGGSRRAIAAGIVAFLLFCTRPDGALYFWIPAFFIGLAGSPERDRRVLGAYVAAFVVPWILLTVARMLYFQDVFPNTYYAKRGEGARMFIWLLDHLSLAAAGLVVVLIGTLVVTGVAIGSHALGRWTRRRVSASLVRRHGLSLFFATALLVHQALPGDWMPEYRFATPAFLFGPAASLGILWDLTRRWGRGRALAPIATAVALALAAAYSLRHTAAFVRAPTVPFEYVRDLTRRIARNLDRLGPGADVLTPDIGGALWENRFRVVDLAGLTDRPLARSVGHDQESVRDHILNQRRPAGVWVHSFWMHATGFPYDPLFRAAYAPVWEERSGPDSAVAAGFYLRRDLVPSPGGSVRARLGR